MCRAASRSGREDESLLAPHLSLGYPPTTAFTSAYVREPCNGVVQSWSQSAFGSGASAGPEITSPVGLKRDP